LAEEEGGPEVVEEKTIVFYEDELIAVKMKDGSIYVPVRRLCDNLGIDWSAQYRRIQRDEVLEQMVNSVAVTATQLEEPHARPEQEMLCLPLEFIPGWLFGITASRVNEDVREKLIRYRRECFRVLWDAFKGDMLPDLQEPATDLTPAEQTLVQTEALYNLARQQVVMERWLVHHDRRLEETEDRLTETEDRLGSVEGVVEDLRLRVQGPQQLISEEQRAELANAVKAVAYALTQHDKSKNWYQSIYGEMYRRFKVSSYKQVPASRFGAVMAWLKEYEAQFG
jgi:hypothetical protein